MSPYITDILAQPAVLQSVITKLSTSAFDPAIKATKYRRIVLTGMGSSLHALYPLHRALSSEDVTSHWIEAAELLLGFDSFFAKDTLLIAVSQSGESAEVAKLMERASEFGHVIGVTNNAASTLGRAAGTVLLMQAGVESTVSCKTYLATLAGLHWLKAQLTVGDARVSLDELAQVQSAVSGYLSKWKEHVAELVPLLNGVTSVFVTGRGDSLATAGTGGLILKESTRQHAEGMSAAAFRHGPLEMAGAKVLVLIFEGDATTAVLHRRLADDIVRGGGRALLIGEQATAVKAFQLLSVPATVRPIVEILPIQMLSLALAERDGFEAGRFERASKITNIA